MRKKGILFVLSGPSGTGKGTVCKALLEKERELHLSVSATTRECRSGEVPGETYHYVTFDKFESMIADGEMLEYAKYNGNYYGTPGKSVNKLLNEGKDVMLEIEPQGALQVKKLFPEAVLIFLIPPSMRELKARLEKRGRETAEEIAQRLEFARWELTQADKYTTQIVNDNPEVCVHEVMAYLNRKRAEQEMINALINEKLD